MGPLSPGVLVGKVAAAPPHLKHCKVQGQGHRQSSGPLRFKAQDTRVTEDKDELSALHIGRTESMNADKASISPAYRWDTAGRIVPASFVPVGCPHPALTASKPLQRAIPHTHVRFSSWRNRFPN